MKAITNKNSNYIYWSLPVLIFLAQAVYTLSTTSQIRVEEVVETFRSAWWFQNRLVWNGSYSFLGWSGTLTFFYNIFGINIFTPKFIKLFFELISYFAMASVFKNYFGIKRAWLSLLLIGLSPSLIYFNSLQLSMGMEVSLFFICLYIIGKLDFEKALVSYVLSALIWITAMYAWLTYFGFMFYLPILAGFYLVKLFKKKKASKQFFITHLGLSLAAFLLPLILGVLYITNRELLIYDPLLHRGLFRSFASFDVNMDVWLDNLQRLSSDLFFKPVSYYFEMKKGEFSDVYPIISLVGIFIAAVMVGIREKKLRLQIILIGFFMSLYFILINYVGPKTLGGIRRGTILLVLFYGLIGLLYNYSLTTKKLSKAIKVVVIFSAFLLLFHHVIVYPVNLADAKTPSIFLDKWLFTETYPEKLVASLVDQASKQKVVLNCQENPQIDSRCPGLSIIYSVIASNCFYNKLYCQEIFVHDSKTDKTMPLTIEFWGKEPHAEP